MKKYFNYILFIIILVVLSGCAKINNVSRNPDFKDFITAVKEKHSIIKSIKFNTKDIALNVEIKIKSNVDKEEITNIFKTVKDFVLQEKILDVTNQKIDEVSNLDLEAIYIYISNKDTNYTYYSFKKRRVVDDVAIENFDIWCKWDRANDTRQFIK